MVGYVYMDVRSDVPRYMQFVIKEGRNRWFS